MQATLDTIVATGKDVTADSRKAAASQFAEQVKTAGIASNASSPFFGKMHDTIKDDNKKQAKAREGIMYGIAAMASSFGSAAEPYLLPMLGAVLKCLADKSKAVREASETARKTLVSIASPHATAQIIVACIEMMDTQESWQTLAGACYVISELVTKAPDQVENCLPEVIPAVKPLLGDTKAEVASAAIAVLESSINLVDNRDIVPVIPALIEALKDSSQTLECIHKLAGTTFVATVSRGPLSIIVPLLVSGFREPKTATRRMCAKIAGNMAKLVDNQVEACRSCRRSCRS